MSDPVSNREIEDVLSSIRRLVSVENRGEGRDVDPPAARRANPETETPDAQTGSQEPARSSEEAKLVLTPSFRVRDAEAASREGHDRVADEPVGADQGDDSLSLEQWQVTADREEEQSEGPGERAANETSTADAGAVGSVDTSDHEDTGEADQGDAARHLSSDDEEEAGSLPSDRLPDEDPAESFATDEPYGVEIAASELDADEDDHEADEVEVSQDPSEDEAYADDGQDHDAQMESLVQGLSKDAETSDKEAADEALADAFAEADYARPEDTAVNDENSDDDTDAEATFEDLDAGVVKDRELEARIAEVEAAVAARHDAWEPEGESEDDNAARKGQPLPWKDYTGEDDDEADTDDDTADHEALTEAAPVMPEPDPEPEHDAERAGADDPKDHEEASPDASQDGAPVDNVSSEASLLAAMRASRAGALAARGKSGPDRPDPEDHAEAPNFVSRRTDLDPEPQQPEPEADTAEVRDPEHAQAAEPVAEEPERLYAPTPEPDKAPEPRQEKRAEDWYSDDAVMDEDALRDLVADIVRQELQGSLGERITRNVRKLVRREIHRAMMGQEFD